MIAREAFEELGYRVSYESKTMITYIQHIEGTRIYAKVTFNSLQKKVFVSYSDLQVTMGIDLPLLKAINKQIEELGWMDN